MQITSAVSKEDRSILEVSTLSRVLQGSRCMHDELGRYDRYTVEDVVIYSYGIIFLTKALELKKKLPHAAHEGFLAMHLNAYFALLEEFTWEGIQHDLYQHMDRCIAQIILERLAQPFPYSLEVRESIQMSHFSSSSQVHGRGGIISHVLYLFNLYE